MSSGGCAVLFPLCKYSDNEVTERIQEQDFSKRLGNDESLNPPTLKTTTRHN